MRCNLVMSLLAISAISVLGGFPAMAETETAEQETVAVFGAGELQVPAEFKRVKPQNGIIEHEFEAKAGEGDDAATARVTMMAAGGGVESNITRWKGQFVGGDADAQKTEEFKAGPWEVHLVDASGSYAERMGGGPFAGGKVINHENYAMAGAILVNPEGRSFFVKMIGPAAVVKANRENFVKMIKSIGK